MNKHEIAISKLLDTFGQDLMSTYKEMVIEYAPRLFPKCWILLGLKNRLNEVLEEIPLLDLVGCDETNVYLVMDYYAEKMARQIVEDRMLEDVKYA